jgi:hypothetical protein
LPGNAKKPAVISWAASEYGLELDEHEADALGIAAACLFSPDRALALLEGRAA